MALNSLKSLHAFAPPMVFFLCCSTAKEYTMKLKSFGWLLALLLILLHVMLVYVAHSFVT
jgi:hypothetical protein